jgi:hypothetical protein
VQNIPVWDLSYRNDKVKQIIRAEYIARIEEERNACGALLGKSEVKKSLGRPRRRWENNITMDLRETGREVGTGFSWLRAGINGGLL